MKAGSIPFVRAFGPGAQGPDVHAVKRALKKAGDGQGENTDTDTFGAAAQHDLIVFKRAAKLTPNATYTEQAHRALTPFFDEYGASLLAREAVLLAAQAGRTKFVGTYRWMIANHGLFDYAQVRPIPLSLPPLETTSRIRTDCSGSVTLAARWSGVPDPNGLNYNGEGNTGTLLAHCAKITAADVKPGDLIWYGSSVHDEYGHHIVAVLEPSGALDFLCGSDGHQGAPEQILASTEAARQAALGYPTVRYLRWLP